MMWFLKTYKSSIGKKLTMGLTGFFLISFLVVHAGINALIFYNDGGETFNKAAHFMGTNPIIRTVEIILVLGILLHIIQSFLLWFSNRAARPVGYAMVNSSARVSWYSKSMTLLGTLILIFLILHTSNFWIPNRTNQFLHGHELPLYVMLLEKFSNPLQVLIYLLGIFSLFWHLLHGFSSAFQSLGINHPKYNGLIKCSGRLFSLMICLTFAMMPISIFLKWIQ
jgi:succinate dehydrogenase / fumarate reductase cytochrome b subunit